MIKISSPKVLKMNKKKKLNETETAKVKAYFKRLQEVEGLSPLPFSEEDLSSLHATYNIILKKGNGDPIEAANWRLRYSGSIK